MGRAVSHKCSAEGATVVMMARGQQRLAEAASEVGDRAVPITCDVVDPNSVREAFSQVQEKFGKADAVLDIAGVARIKRIEDASDDDIQFVFGVNLLGPVYVTRAAVPLLRAAGGGDLVFVSSEIVGEYLPRMVLYGASKGGLNEFARQMMHELKPEGIRVTRYTSGSIAGSSFGDNFDPEDVQAAYPEWIESGYLSRVSGPAMDAEWMADAMLFTITRPKGQLIDIIHVRSAAHGATTLRDH